MGDTIKKNNFSHYFSVKVKVIRTSCLAVFYSSFVLKSWKSTSVIGGLFIIQYFYLMRIPSHYINNINF